MKAITICVLCLLVLTQAADVSLASRLRLRRAEAAQQAAAQTEVDCVQMPSRCQQQQAFVASSNGGGSDFMAAPEDVVQPIDEWIKSFKQKVGGGSLYEAARATVRPLIERLRRTQQRAQEAIARSNREILERVEESATEHVYNMLRASNKQETKQEQAQERKEELSKIKDEIAEKKEQAKSESAAAKAAVAKVAKSADAAKIAQKEEKKLEKEVKKELEKSKL